MRITEELHNHSLYLFIKINMKVTLEEIKVEFPIEDGVINLHNLIDSDLQQLIDMGKIQLKEGYYTVTDY